MGVYVISLLRAVHSQCQVKMCHRAGVMKGAVLRTGSEQRREAEVTRTRMRKSKKNNMSADKTIKALRVQDVRCIFTEKKKQKHTHDSTGMRPCASGVERVGTRDTV